MTGCAEPKLSVYLLWRAQDYRDELQTPECQKQVHVLSVRAAQDVRFDEPLADACYDDRAKLCDGVQPVRDVLCE